MSKEIKIKKGVNINLKGKAELVFAAATPSSTFSVKPTDFHGLVPKLAVKTGDEVKAGTALFYDKYNEKIKYASPVSGEIVDVIRGEKRKLLEIRILPDKEIHYEQFTVSDPNKLSGEEVKNALLQGGLWPIFRQRPYDVVANPDRKPKAIFISAFNSAPLAPDYDFIIHGQGDVFQTGLDALSKLCEGNVHLNVNAEAKSSGVFRNAKNVQINSFSGPHPSGNVGVQIHHISPINKGEVVWYIAPQDVLSIGKLFKEGKFDATRVIALTGSSVKKPRYYKTLIGSGIKEFLKDNIESGNLRYISGNVLTGTKINPDGHLGFYDDQITVIPEGDKPEFLGWIAPGFDKFSLSRTFFSWLNPSKVYELDTNMHGEERPFVMTGQYEKVFPMDIYPQQLLKAIIIGDLELMENLGIYEVAPEDFALCEFVCTSKIKAQEIIRKGLDYVQKECG